MVGNDPLSTRVGNTLFKVVGPQLTTKFRKEAGGDTVLVDGLSKLPFSAVFFLNLLPWDDDPDGTAVQVKYWRSVFSFIHYNKVFPP